MLGANDFRTEQSYFREKAKLHNRCLHGHGVVCGLRVTPAPWGIPEPGCMEPEERERLERIQEALAAIDDRMEQIGTPADEETRRKLDELLGQRDELLRELHCPSRVLIECGLALDCEGNEVVVRDTLCVDIWQHLSPMDRSNVESERRPVFVSICYEALPIEPTRPILSDLCASASTCHYGKTRDSVCVVVSTERPQDDQRCEPCCESCDDTPQCVLLAEIRGFQRWVPVHPHRIHNEVRRPLTRYLTTTVTGINWVHGGAYPPESLDSMLPDGVLFEFSRPVRIETLRQGIIDVLVFKGGKQFAGAVQFLSGEVQPDEVSGDYARQVRFKPNDPGSVFLEPGDRLMFILRASFVLDKCCEPVDGEHIGGWVPRIPGSPPPPEGVEQIRPPGDCGGKSYPGGPWMSGNRTPGGSFESWLYIRDTD